ncbi:hypothetical protein ACHQM5_017947 [Ranunculus cassubicifolius]
MESLRIARLVIDVPPPSFVSVMRREIFDMGTINEEEMEIDLPLRLSRAGSPSAWSSLLKENKKSLPLLIITSTP